jgi:hypothetical protein
MLRIARPMVRVSVFLGGFAAAGILVVGDLSA